MNSISNPYESNGATPLTLAVPKGRILEPLVQLLEEAGVSCQALQAGSRRLVVDDEAQGLRFILAKPSDVPTYVEYGAADVGFVGKDVLMERPQGISELLDLGIARCRLILAVPAASDIRSVRDFNANMRVATTYPRTTTRFFHQHGLQAEVVFLHGSIELAPLVGLADAVVDITETGSTLRANGLVVIDEIAPISTRLIANPIRHKVYYDRIEGLVERLRSQINGQSADPHSGPPEKGETPRISQSRQAEAVAEGGADSLGDKLSDAGHRGAKKG